MYDIMNVLGKFTSKLVIMKNKIGYFVIVCIISSCRSSSKILFFNLNYSCSAYTHMILKKEIQ